MKRTLTLIASLHLSVTGLSAADLKPDATTEIPESSKRPVVVKLDKSAIRNPQSAIPKADLPEGYELVTVAAAPLVTHPIMGCIDDRGRLFVGDGTGVNWNKKQLEANPPNRILCLEDTDGDGNYDKSTIFADKMTFPQGGCWLNGSLYVCSPPSIWKLTDTDGDGVADKREEIVTGFEYTGNAADVHGPWLHPNGRLYWCHGRKGHKVTGKEGIVIHEGLASGIWSCKPDGSDVQWHSLGCGDNPVKVDFTPEGEIIGTQNLYYSQPRGDTIVHWLYGGVYERPDMMKAIEGLPRTLEHMPVMHNFGHVAVSGCCFWRNYTGSADSLVRSAASKGGAAAKDKNADKTVGAPSMAGAPLQFMVTHFNTQRVVRMELTPDGATYKATENEFLTLHDADAHFTDVLEDADGSLLVLNTGGWFRIGCPASLMAKPDALGAVYRVRKKGSATRAELVKQGKPDPWGRDIKWYEKSIGELAVLLGDDWFSVVNKAKAELIRRGPAASYELKNLLPALPAKAQVEAIWVYSHFDTKETNLLLRSALSSGSPSVQRAGCYASVNRLVDSDLVTLKQLARSDNARVRMAALRPLAWFGLDYLDAHRSLDVNDLCRSDIGPAEEHALLIALSRPTTFSAQIPLPQITITGEVRSSGNDACFFGARRPDISKDFLARCMILGEINGASTPRKILGALGGSSKRETAVAVEIIKRHPEWAGDVAATILSALGTRKFDDSQLTALEGVAVAFVTHQPIQERLATMLVDDSTSVRQFALRVIASQSSGTANDAWLPPLEKMLDAMTRSDGFQPSDSSDGKMPSLLVLDAIKKLKSDRFDEKLQAIASDTKRPLALRLKALDSMKGVKLTGDTFVMVKGVLADAGSSAAARIQAATMLANAPLDKEQQLTVAPLLASAGPVELEKLLALLRKPKDTDIARTFVTELAKNPVIASQQESVYRTALSAQPPDVFETIVLPAIRKANEASDAKRRQLAPLAEKVIAQGDASAGRAIFESGKGTCIACHQIGDKGRAIGPDLSKIGAIRTERDLLESILFPSNTLARDYEAHIIESSDGQNIMGVIKSHTAEGLLVVDVAGLEKNVPHTSIIANTTLTTSLMPMGLDQTLAEKELCDLVAWLRSLK